MAAFSRGFFSTIISSLPSPFPFAPSPSTRRVLRRLTAPLLLAALAFDLCRGVSVDEYLFFEILSPREISYSFKIRAAKDFGTPLNFSLGRVRLVPTDPPDACATVVNAEDVEGNVAFVERGGCSFLSKTIQSERAGSRAVIVYDNVRENDNSYIDMVQDETTRETRIPSLFLLGSDGYIIKNKLKELSSPYAVINIPVNMSNVLTHQARLAPWNLW